MLINIFIQKFCTQLFNKLNTVYYKFYWDVFPITSYSFSYPLTMLREEIPYNCVLHDLLPGVDCNQNIHEKCVAFRPLNSFTLSESYTFKSSMCHSPQKLKHVHSFNMTHPISDEMLDYSQGRLIVNQNIINL